MYYFTSFYLALNYGSYSFTVLETRCPRTRHQQGFVLLFHIINIYCKIFKNLFVLIGGGESNGTPLQCSCLENPRDGGAWWAAVHGIAKSRTRLSDFTVTFHFHALEKAMATHSRVLTWRIPGTGEPGGLPSMGSHRVEHD